MINRNPRIDTVVRIQKFLEERKGQPVTFSKIHIETGISYRSVLSGIAHLQQRGDLQTISDGHITFVKWNEAKNG